MAILYPDTNALNAKRKKGSGRKRKYSVAEVQSKVKAVRFRYRQNLRTLAKHTGIPKSTISIKPILTDANKKQELTMLGRLLAPMEILLI